MAKKSKARDISYSHRRRLDILSGNQCANPECSRSFVGRDGKTIVSKICHIEAAEKGGARYNKKSNDDVRRHFDNLILLCDECHTIVDNKENEAEYPVKLLKKWKKEHEDKQKEIYLRTNSGLLMQAINAIADVNFDELDNEKIESSKSFGVEAKIKYNNIMRNRETIDEYAPYFAIINPLYSELEKHAPFRKDKLLRNIRQIYLRVKGKIVNGRDNEIEIIQQYADDIYEQVESELFELVEKQNLIKQDDVFFAIPVIMVDAFMRCKILEEPES